MARNVSPLSQVPDKDLERAWRITHKSVSALLEQGYTYKALSQKIAINESALKQFVKRGRESLSATEPTRFKRGLAFTKIYEFVHGSRMELDEAEVNPGLRTLIEEVEGLSYADKVRAATYLIKSVLQVSNVDCAIAKKKISGTYVCFRNATIDDLVVQSVLSISETEQVDGETVWEFRHAHYDSSGALKSSDGMFLFMPPKIYLLGDVSSGRGLDFICLTDQVTENPLFMSGFEISVDHNHVVYFAKIFLQRASKLYEPMFFSDDFLKKNTGPVLKREIESRGIGGDIGLGKNMLNSLKITDQDKAVVLGSTIIPNIVSPTFPIKKQLEV